MDNTIPLSETTKFIVDNRGKTAPTEEDGIALIATNCIDNKNLYPIFNKVRYVSEETFKNWFRSHPEPGDILLTLKGSQNGAVCLVPDPVNFVIAQDMVGLRVDETIIDPLFLFAALRSKSTQHQIKMLDVSGVIPHLKKSDFDKLILPYPARTTQTIIGKIYYNLSKKIDLLHRQNKTLEAMAETLFREWFVEGAQEGFKAGYFSEFVEDTFGGDWGKEEPEDDYSFEVKCIRGTDIGDLQKGLAQKCPTRFVKESKFKRVAPRNGDLIIEISGGTEGQSTGRTIYIDEGIMELFEVPLLFSNFCRLIRLKNPNHLYFVYLYISHLYDFGHFFNLQNGSSGIRNLNYKAFINEYPLMFPVDREVIISFNELVKGHFVKINKNKTQIRTLENLRNTLLPKLMSGEIRIPSEL